MGSLYDNSGEDIYARRDIEKRRKHAMAMKKKRKRQILKRKIMLFTGAAAILVASLGLTAAVRKNNTASGSSLNPKETQQVAIDANADAANDDNIDKKDEKKFVYAQKSSDYKEITDAAVRTPYVALLVVNNKLKHNPVTNNFFNFILYFLSSTIFLLCYTIYVLLKTDYFCNHRLVGQIL